MFGFFSKKEAKQEQQVVLADNEKIEMIVSAKVAAEKTINDADILNIIVDYITQKIVNATKAGYRELNFHPLWLASLNLNTYGREKEITGKVKQILELNGYKVKHGIDGYCDIRIPYLNIEW